MINTNVQCPHGTNVLANSNLACTKPRVKGITMPLFVAVNIIDSCNTTRVEKAVFCERHEITEMRYRNKR